jgi:lysophospholipase L1-like esterase
MMEDQMLTPVLSALLFVLSTVASLRAADGVPGRPYLALGDSISFGFIANAGYAYLNPDNFIGLPNYLSEVLPLSTVNASCPGETTGSFLSSTAPDNGCRFYRSLVPLHVTYSSTQADFAIAFVKSHPEVKLVTIGLGANDVLLLEAQCANDSSCIANHLPQVLAAVTENLETILGDLRSAGYKGTIVIMNYYSLDDTDPNITATFQLLNKAIATAAASADAPVADIFNAFQNAASRGDGHICHAGLLNSLPQNQFLCDIHPSLSGQALIARTVERAAGKTQQRFSAAKITRTPFDLDASD